jgi:hypothetical protein
VERLDRDTLLNLLTMYEATIRELEDTHDPLVAGLLRRLERRRGEVTGALAAQYLRPDE